MIVFNKVVTTLVLLILIPVVTVVLIVPREAVQVLNDWFTQLEDQLSPTVSTAALIVRVVIALLLDALLVLLLYLEVRRPSKQAVKVQQVSGGEAQLAVESIVERLTYHIDPLPGVLDVSPTVVPHRRGVEVTLDIEMAADASVPENLESVSDTVRQVIEQEMGLKLSGKPKLNLRTVLYPEPTAKSEAVARQPAYDLPDEAADESEPEGTGGPDGADASG
jgi:hypothetical protein